jgi:hypothetical protein
MKYILILLPLLLSCSKPNYVSSSEFKDQNTEAQTSCPFYFEEERLCLSTQWTTYPSEQTQGVFIMRFYAEDKPDESVTPHLSPAVKLWMPSMGHGSSPVVITQTAPGTYVVSDVYFIMLGAWEIRLQLKNNNEVIEEKIQKINL